MGDVYLKYTAAIQNNNNSDKLILLRQVNIY